MGLTSSEKAELSTYQLKDVAQTWLDIQDKPRFKKRFSNQVPSKFTKTLDDRVSNPKSQKGRGTSLPNKKPTCAKCRKGHLGECLVGIGNCFSCGKSGHKVRYCPNLKGQDKGRGKSQTSGSNVDASKKNHFYALRSRVEQETSPDVVTAMSKVFSIDVYALLDSGATLSFITPLVSKKFDILPDILNEPFMVTTPVGESVIAKRVYRNCPLMFHNRVTHVELVEFDMIDFDVILGMDSLHASVASIDCRTRVLTFQMNLS
ncbi:uncharacterized protein [Solanum lycopersicum]|uniref:uncharacterized protein n=1 Tax=Solanum lycopersicum TaxID=4081 RepID=UPI0037489D25